MTVPRLALLAVAALLAAPAHAAAAPSTARLVAVTAPPAEHRADPGLRTPSTASGRTASAPTR